MRQTGVAEGARWGVAGSRLEDVREGIADGKEVRNDAGGARKDSYAASVDNSVKRESRMSSSGGRINCEQQMKTCHGEDERM